jgi:hypothetical protein
MTADNIFAALRQAEARTKAAAMDRASKANTSAAKDCEEFLPAAANVGYQPTAYQPRSPAPSSCNSSRPYTDR